jgi:hypothetical protein
MVEQEAESTAPEGVTAIHLDGHHFEIPRVLASEIFDQLEVSVDANRAVILMLSDEACIMIAPDDPMVIFVPNDVVEAEV